MSDKTLGFIAAISFMIVGFVLNAFLQRTIGDSSDNFILPILVLLPSMTIGSICIGKLVSPNET